MAALPTPLTLESLRGSDGGGCSSAIRAVGEADDVFDDDGSCMARIAPALRGFTAGLHRNQQRGAVGWKKHWTENLGLGKVILSVVFKSSEDRLC